MFCFHWMSTSSKAWTSTLGLFMPQITIHVKCMVSPLGKLLRFEQNRDSFNGLVGTAFCYFLSHFSPEQSWIDLTDICSIFFSSSTKYENDMPSEHSFHYCYICHVSLLPTSQYILFVSNSAWSTNNKSSTS